MYLLHIILLYLIIFRRAWLFQLDRLSRASKIWGREDARLRNFFENLHKICTFERKTGKTSFFLWFCTIWQNLTIFLFTDLFPWSIICLSFFTRPSCLLSRPICQHALVPFVGRLFDFVPSSCRAVSKYFSLRVFPRF